MNNLHKKYPTVADVPNGYAFLIEGFRGIHWKADNIYFYFDGCRPAGLEFTTPLAVKEILGQLDKDNPLNIQPIPQTMADVDEFVWCRVENFAGRLFRVGRTIYNEYGAEASNRPAETHPVDEVLYPVKLR